ncbi:MAG TPA: hypothetical protein VKU77_13790, partial [Streptosporangiaceae bacterium]|nr:hypothetical protein [Streptosporangiaceae bacterium]
MITALLALPAATLTATLTAATPAAASPARTRRGCWRTALNRRRWKPSAATTAATATAVSARHVAVIKG